MLIVTTTLKLPPKKQKEILQTLYALSEPILKKDGCVSYNVYQKIGSTYDYCLIEKWRSRENWNDYLLSDQFKVLMGAMGLLKEMPDIQISTVSHVNDASTLMTNLKGILFEMDADVTDGEVQ